MEERREELSEEEVNVYSGCGDVRNACFEDCFDGSAWLSTDH